MGADRGPRQLAATAGRGAVSQAYAGTVAVSAAATISFHCSGRPLENQS